MNKIDFQKKKHLHKKKAFPCHNWHSLLLATSRIMRKASWYDKRETLEAIAEKLSDKHDSIMTSNNSLTPALDPPALNPS